MPPYVTRGSWYSQLPPFGWFDRGDKPNSNALGVPDWQQGIALPSRRTLGQWYNVTPPGETIPYPFQQTDTGPAPYTGRGVDISAAAAHQMGYTPKTFPTDAQFKVEPRDEPRGLGSPAGLPVQAGDLPDNATEGTAVASGPPARKSMPDSLMDMFQPRSAVDNTPIGYGDAIAQNRQSLIGLGMGLLTPRSLAVGAPTSSAWSNALGGYQQGAQTDAANAYRQAQLAHTKRQEDFQRSQAAQAQANFERTFGEGQMTEAEKLARASGFKPGTPEHGAFIAKAIQAKAGESLVAQFEQRQAIAKAQGLDITDPKIKNWIAGGGKLNEEGSPLAAETAARVAMGGKFLDEAPGIRKQIESGMATDTAAGKIKTYFNMGDQGEVARKVKSGTEALLRALTGAGMGITEAQKYVARYELQPTDTSKTALSKFDQLRDELSRTEQEAFRGHGGIPRDITERRKAAHAAIDKAVTATAPAPTVEPPEKSIKFLKANPSTRDQFDAMYGEGAAMRILQGK